MTGRLSDQATARRRAPRLAAALAAILLAAPCGPAAAQTGDWRAAAPALAIEGTPRPLSAPVTIGGSAWGPWRSLCREQTTRPGRPMQRDCLAVAEARPDGSAVRLTLVQQQLGLRISALRDADGRLQEFSARSADGSAPPPDSALDGLLAAWRDQFATLSLERRRIAPREDLSLPVAGSPRGGTCRPEGTAALGGRAVLVARCAVELAGRLRGGESDARVAIFARIAIDIPTGMVVAQGYATRIETFGAGGRSNGVVVTPSRVVLE